MRLGTYLRERGMTQREFAARIGVSRSYLSMLISGDKVPSLKTATKIEVETGGVVTATAMLDQAERAAP
ncbi:MAG: helix-turn-helix transcriptional regulator [Paracoccaceae bacterium]